MSIVPRATSSDTIDCISSGVSGWEKQVVGEIGL